LSTTKYTDPIACSLVVIAGLEQCVVTVEAVEDPIRNERLTAYASASPESMALL
jgi:hypothetical protein